LEILQQGCHFLDFPSDSMIQKMMIKDESLEERLKSVQDIFAVDAKLQSMADIKAV